MSITKKNKKFGKRSLEILKLAIEDSFEVKPYLLQILRHRRACGGSDSGGCDDVVRICATSVEDGAHPHCGWRPLHAAHS